MTATRHHSREYDAYMRSPAWTARKKLWDAMATPRQRRCQARSWRCHGPLHLHHVRYARWGRSTLGTERHRDLVRLCERHHRNLHRLSRRHHLSVLTASRFYLLAARVRRYGLPPAVVVLVVLVLPRVL